MEEGGIISVRFKYGYVYWYMYENRYSINGRGPEAGEGIRKEARVEDVHGIHNSDKERS